jgi:hypothetical protein
VIFSAIQGLSLSTFTGVAAFMKLACLVLGGVFDLLFAIPSLSEAPDGDIQVASRTGGCEGVIGKCIFAIPSLTLLIVACVGFFSFQTS